VIRGLDGPRIRVLQNGLGTLDASVTSPDHAVVSDALQAKRVEIVRGAGTLLYSSAAIGGVVNVDDGRIPMQLPDEWVEGDLRAVYGSAANEKSVGGGLTAGFGPMALRGAGFFRDTDNLEIPDFPVSDTYAEANPGTDRGPEGHVPNSDARSAGGTAGAAWIFDTGALGAAYGIVDSEYGIPSSPGGEETRIDLEQQRGDLRGEWERDLAAFEKATLQLGYASYEHTELEAGVEGTRFENDAWEGRLELVQKDWRELHGSAGFQFLLRDFSAAGEEVFVPPNETFSWGLFAVEEIHLGSLIVEAGLRFERQVSESRARDVERSFNGVSVSAGIGWSPREDTRLGLSVSRTQRPPAAEELFSDGPHLATRGYDVGDPGLDPEVGLTVEAAIRKRAGRLTGGVNAFYTRFEDYIFLENDGPAVAEGYPELMRRVYRQSAADFYGGEAQLAVEAYRGDLFTGAVDLALDYVRAQEDRTEQPLPRIPPLRLKAGLEARSRYLDGRLELWWVGKQDRTANFELPTDAYFLLNASVTLHPLPDDYDATLLVQGRNLTDEEARNHVSFLKDFVPLPGRDVRVLLRIGF
jgi:iron complex outermembrane receptor protein